MKGASPGARGTDGREQGAKWEGEEQMREERQAVPLWVWAGGPSDHKLWPSREKFDYNFSACPMAPQL